LFKDFLKTIYRFWELYVKWTFQEMRLYLHSWTCYINKILNTIEIFLTCELFWVLWPKLILGGCIDKEGYYVNENFVPYFYLNVYSFIIIYFKHKKKSYPFPPPHIAIIVWFDYISTKFGHFKFANDLLH
jgi:hypothetical protein